MLAKLAANTGPAYTARSPIPTTATTPTIAVATHSPLNASVETWFILSVTATGTGCSGGKL